MTGVGRFISIEGVEGVGKSTSIDRIATSLERHGIPYVTTREPGGTPLSERIRELLLDKDNMSMAPITELLLMFAARAQHVNEFIKPTLTAGHWVVCDRFTDSTYAYQGGGRGIDVGLIEQMEKIALENFRPDLVLLLDLPVDEGISRALNRGEKDRFESEDITFFNRVRDVFLSRAAGDSRYQIVDASGPPEVVGERLDAIIEAEVELWRAAG